MSDNGPNTASEEFDESVDELKATTASALRPYAEWFRPYAPYFFVAASVVAFVEAMLTSDPVLGFLAGSIFVIGGWVRDVQLRRGCGHTEVGDE